MSLKFHIRRERRLALCIWNEVFTGLPAGNDMQRQNDLRGGVPKTFVGRRLRARSRNVFRFLLFFYFGILLYYMFFFLKKFCDDVLFCRTILRTTLWQQRKEHQTRF